MRPPAEPQTFADPRLGADRLWRETRVERFALPAPALFLDRDGVIIEEKEYIADPAQVELLPGIADLIRIARASGMAVVEVTNQAGIARGYLGWPEFVAVENRTRQLLAAQGVQLDAVFACPFHSEGRAPYAHPDHAWRKPNPGMLLAAAELLNLDLPRSILVGDKIADQQAALAAGLAGGIHVLTGHGNKHAADARALSSNAFPIQVVSNAQEGAAVVRQAASRRSSLWTNPAPRSPDGDSFEKNTVARVRDQFRPEFLRHSRHSGKIRRGD
jgi:D-glycero-D-manno-heptose 1,7-bisphosphate phosphatase